MSISPIETAPSVLPPEELESSLRIESTKHLQVVHSAVDTLSDLPIIFDLYSIPSLYEKPQLSHLQKPSRYSKFWSNYNKYNPSYRHIVGDEESDSASSLELRLNDQNQRPDALKALETFHKPSAIEGMQLLAARVLADIKKPQFHYDHGIGIPQSTRLGSIALRETPDGYRETVVVSPRALLRATSCLSGIQEKHRSADIFAVCESEAVKVFKTIPAREKKLEFETFVRTVASTALLAGMNSAKLFETPITMSTDVGTPNKPPLLTLV